MSGKILKEVHKCEPPKVLKRYNKGTVWECDCGANFEIIDIFGEMEWRTEAECRNLEKKRSQTYWDYEGKYALAGLLFAVTIMGFVIFWVVNV